MGDSRESDIINYMLMVIPIAFISFVFFTIFFRKFCLSNEGDDEPPRIKK